jgi:hypothetical protein
LTAKGLLNYCEYIFVINKEEYMPAFDGMGPRGMGSLSGRGLGSCKGRRRCGQGAMSCFRSSFLQNEDDRTKELQAWREILIEKLRWVEEELSKGEKKQ